MLSPDIFDGFLQTILSIILPVFFFCLIIFILLSFLKSKKRPIRKNINYNYQKKSLFSNNELSFYKTLLPIANKHQLTVFTKVKLSDIIKSANNNHSAFLHINQKHLDFVLSSNSNYVTNLVIELDDKSHDNESTKIRDADKDRALNSAGIPVLRVRNTNDLEKKILEKIAPKATATKQ